MSLRLLLGNRYYYCRNSVQNIGLGGWINDKFNVLPSGDHQTTEVDKINSELSLDTHHGLDYD